MYESNTLRNRVQRIFAAFPQPELVITAAAEAAEFHRTNLQRYLAGQKSIRLNNLGRVIVAAKTLAHDVPMVAKSRTQIEQMARLEDLVAELAPEEYSFYGVTGPEGMLEKLYQDIGEARVPPLPWHQILDEIIERYEEPSRDVTVDGRVRRVYEHTLYIPLTATRRSVIRGAGGTVALAETLMREFVEDDDRRYLLLLGSLGTGKTTTLKHLCYSIAQQGVDQVVRLPIFIDLRSFKRAVDLKRAIQSSFEEQFGDALRLDALQVLIDSGRILLVLDGLDEMAERIGNMQQVRHLKEVVDLVRTNTGAKVILSSRTHHFRGFDDLREIHERVGAADLLKDSLLVLNPFTDADWRTYVERIFGEAAPSVIARLEGITNHRSLTTHPLLLDMATKALPELGDEFTRSMLYRRYVDGWLEREKWRTNLTKEEREALVTRVAWGMFQKDTSTITSGQLEGIAGDKLSEAFRHDREALLQEIRTASFFVTQDDGTLEFASPIFQSYFTALGVREHIRNNAPRGVGMNLLSGDIVDLVVEEIAMPSAQGQGEAASPDSKSPSETLLGWISLTRGSNWVRSDTGDHLASNAKMILSGLQKIEPDVIELLQNVIGRDQIMSDPVLAKIVSSVVLRLRGSQGVTATKIIEAYTGRWVSALRDATGLDAEALLEEIAWNTEYLSPSLPLDLILESAWALGLAPRFNRVLEAAILESEFLQDNGTGSFAFQHPYLARYFVARAIARRLRENRPDRIGQRVFSDELIAFILEVDSKPSRRIISDWIRSSADHAKATDNPYLATNALMLLAATDPEGLPGLEYENTVLREVRLPNRVNLEGAQMQGVNLSRANLTRARLGRANLRGATLSRAQLQGATLTDADLSGADLSYADLSGAYLNRCNLDGAILDHAKLTGASTTPANFTSQTDRTGVANQS